MAEAFDAQIFGPVYIPGSTIPGPGAWAPQYPARLDVPWTVAQMGAEAHAVLPQSAAGATPYLVQVWPDPVVHLFPTVFFVPVVAAPVVAPDLWTVVATDVMRGLPVVHPEAWTGPLAPPVAPLGGEAFYPSTLVHLRPEVQSFTWSGFTPAAPGEVTWGWLADYPAQLTRPTPTGGSTHVGGFAPIIPSASSWQGSAVLPLPRPLLPTTTVVVPVGIREPAPDLWGAHYPDITQYARPTYTDESFFSTMSPVVPGEGLFRRTLQQRVGVRTIPTKM